MAGFLPKYNLAGRNTGIQLIETIAASTTLTIGDAVRTVGGYVALAAAGNPVLGIVVGFADQKGIPLDSPETDSDATYTRGGLGVGTVVTDAGNPTDKKVKAIINIDPFQVYSVTPDATIGTTTGSNLRGYYTDIPAASDQTDEDSTTTSGQFYIHGVDPDNSSNQLVSINEHALF